MILTLAATAHAGAVARVLIVEPGAFVQPPEGDKHELAHLDRLDDDATLETNATGVVILQLHNDHLVRIESDLTLPVERIAMLHSPRAKRSVQEQLDALLYPDERERLSAMVSQAEGLGGWHGRLTVAQAVTQSDGGGGSVAPAPARPVDGAQSKQEKGGGSGPKVRGTLGDLASEASEAEGQVVEGWPQIADAYQPGGARAQCVATWNEALAIHILADAITVHPVVTEGTVRRLKVDGALPIPACLREGLVGQPASADAEPVTIRLR